MVDQETLTTHLRAIANWRLISAQTTIATALAAALEQSERLEDIIEGFFIIGTLDALGSGLPGVMALTSHKIIFIYSYVKSKSPIQIAYPDIRDVAIRNGRSVLRFQIRGRGITGVLTVTKLAFDRDTFIASLKRLIEPQKITADLLNQTVESKISQLSNINDATKKAKVIIAAINAYKNFDNNTLFLNRLIDDVLAALKILLRGIGTTNDELKLFVSMIVLNLKQNIIKDRGLILDAFKLDTIPLQNRRHILAHWSVVHNEIYRARPPQREQLPTIRSIVQHDRQHDGNERAKIDSLFRQIMNGILECAQAPPHTRQMLRNELQYMLQSKEEIERQSVEVGGRNEREEREERRRERTAGQIDDTETVADILVEIDTLIGMQNIKEQIRTFINFIKVQEIRKQRGLPTAQITKHAVFNGPPGTGKTTIARYLGRIYRALKLLTKGHMIETDRAGLVAGYVGQTAIQVNEVIEDALDGVLFIDEAYSLSPENAHNDFGQEAIDTLLKRMEDHRERIAIIVAGYPQEMKRFIESNPGLQSRFSRYFYFDHYQPPELLRIFDTFINEINIVLTGQAKTALAGLFRELYRARTKRFGNGRLVRNIFERVVEKQANRIAQIENITDQELCSIGKRDIPLPDEL